MLGSGATAQPFATAEDYDWEGALALWPGGVDAFLRPLDFAGEESEPEGQQAGGPLAVHDLPLPHERPPATSE